MTSDNLRATDTASSRDELREALIEVCWQTADAPHTVQADALLAGPVGDLLDVLDERERLRDKWASACFAAQEECDQALATFQAVREAVDGFEAWLNRRVPTDAPLERDRARLAVSDLRRILDAADGGSKS